MRIVLASAVAAFASLAPAAMAQIVYEPVTVQHGGQNTYYYAGSDSAIHEAARFPSAPGTGWGRTNGYAFVSKHRAVVERTPRIFTDAFGSFDARVYGMTVDDVVNEANARLPRYFRKGELLMSAKVRDGARIVSPYGPESMKKGTILIRPSQIRPSRIQPSSPPLFRRGPVFVVPKGMMDQKVSAVTGEKQV